MTTNTVVLTTDVMQGLVNNTDITSALTARWLEVNSNPTLALMDTLPFFDTSKGIVTLPSGYFYWNGPALSRISEAAPKFIGVGSGQTTIVNLSDDYLFDLSGYMNGFHMKGIKVIGGKGIFKHVVGGSGNNVAGDFVFEDVVGIDLSECAINQNATDNPHWVIDRCKFNGNITNGAIVGIALSGYKDRSIISDTDLHFFKYNMKLAPGPSDSNDKGPGANIVIDNLDTTRFKRAGDEEGTILPEKIADVWIVPNQDTYVNAGYGTRFINQKFGNENFDATSQYKILIADEDDLTGIDNGTRLHSEEVSTGYVGGITVDMSQLQWSGENAKALIYSYTPNIFGFLIGPDIFLGGSIPEYAYVQFDPDVPKLKTYNNSASIFYAPRGENSQLIKLLERPVGKIIDVTGNLQWDETVKLFDTNGQDPSYKNILTNDNPRTNGTMNGGGTLEVISDNSVGDRSALVTFASADDYLYLVPTAANMVADRLAFITALFKAADTNSLSAVLVGIRDSLGNYFGQTQVSLESDVWTSMLLDWVPPDNTSTYRFEVKPVVGTWSATSCALKIALPAVYHAKSPVVTGHLRTYGKGTFNDGHLIWGNTHMWTDQFNRIRINNAQPTSGGNGSIIEYANAPTVRGDVDVTLTASSTKLQRFTTTLTADRSCNLPTASLYAGWGFRVARPATGAFNLNVKQSSTTVKALAAGTWADFDCDGTNWFVSAYGNL